MKDTITFEGERTSMSASGNTEWFEFTITTTKSITKSAARAIGQVYGMGGQTFSCVEDSQDGLNVYKCKATCYSD